MGMRVDIVTLFPEMCQQVLDASIIGRAAKRGYIETHCHQIRDYTLNKQKQTDDKHLTLTADVPKSHLKCRCQRKRNAKKNCKALEKIPNTS